MRASSSAVSPYDALAQHYRSLSEKRQVYLDAVERYVIEHAPKPARRMLDVGAGDGVRGQRIANALTGISDLVLAEPCASMVMLARTINGVTVWPRAVEDLPTDGEKFDVITCLWNVLGHVEGRAARIEGLSRMKALLSPDGSLFIDVNNRHNSAAYGWATVLIRRTVDALLPDERRGDTEVSWTIGDSVVTGSGHLFTPAEMHLLIGAAGLAIREEIAVDYLDGTRSSRLTCGQLVYRMERT